MPSTLALRRQHHAWQTDLSGDAYVRCLSYTIRPAPQAGAFYLGAIHATMTAPSCTHPIKVITYAQVDMHHL